MVTLGGGGAAAESEPARRGRDERRRGAGGWVKAIRSLAEWQREESARQERRERIIIWSSPCSFLQPQSGKPNHLCSIFNLLGQYINNCWLNQHCRTSAGEEEEVGVVLLCRGEAVQQEIRRQE